MDVLYRGFDGLDFSLQGEISPSLDSKLCAAKEAAQRNHGEVVLDWNGVKLHVAESGARGGYAYRASTGTFGATWFFKKPNARDPWGIRVSCNSFMLATYGLGEARSRIYQLLDDIGVKLRPNGESISRVDYAIDFLATDFELVPEHFVMHSNANRADYIEPLDQSVNGKSGKVSSVTIGKMPGRQVIVYDKRAEVIAKHKGTWWTIWNAARAKAGLPDLDWTRPEESRIWRVELRAGKVHLKDRWAVRTWNDLSERFGDLVAATANSIRHTEPKSDRNRSRWPNSELWAKVHSELEKDLFEMRNFAEPDLVKRVHRDAHDQMLAKQMLGLLITRAAICGVEADALSEFGIIIGKEMGKLVRGSPDLFLTKLNNAIERYCVQY